jgi:hypothetical protein
MGECLLLPSLWPITPAGTVMATTPTPSGQSSDPWAWTAAQQRRHVLRCWRLDCDLDPMILRARQLRHQGSLPQATCVEQELLPLF